MGLKKVKIVVLSLLLTFSAVSVVSASSSTVEPLAPGTTMIKWDDFSKGFAPENWFYFSAGDYVGNDGIVTTSNKGLKVVSSGINPTSGEPAFTNTLAQEHKNGGLPGAIDHVKWLAYMNHTSSTGFPGFDAISGKVLSFETWISGRTFGTQYQPFGDAIEAPNDIRLASFAFNTMDMESFMVFDFFITNNQIYAFYERLPLGRGTLGNYAAFSYKIPVMKRNPEDVHRLRISYDKDKGTISWYVDNSKVFQVDKIGHHIDRKYMILDHGGKEELVKPNQLVAGLGLFTLMDAFENGKGLVKLSTEEDFYFDPIQGEPVPLEFVDSKSRESSRIFGQGAKLEVKQVNVLYTPSK
ncbi:DUF6081 family protein [Fredinandcohnia onubensis]|uniref:DUF6081 family protein n=1 Tax=Fredinandcohnia onubensis TaxID=1571209 RepID=UPI000C0BCC72|nr:DUF6081 family protein [Fredinandcohnia onubensis]